jgi:hypothetical protein
VVQSDSGGDDPWPLGLWAGREDENVPGAVAAATSSPTPGADCADRGSVKADPPLLGRAVRVEVDPAAPFAVARRYDSAPASAPSAGASQSLAAANCATGKARSCPGTSTESTRSAGRSQSSSLTEDPVRPSLESGGFYRLPYADPTRQDQRVWLADDRGSLTEHTRTTHPTPPATAAAGVSRSASSAGGYVTRAGLGRVIAVGGRPAQGQQ